MNTSMLQDQIVNESNLKKAWIKTYHHARTALEYFDKYAYDEFAENLELNLSVIQHQIVNQEYHFSDLRVFEIPKGENTRKVYFSTPRDGVVAQAIVNVIAPLFESQFSSNSYGNRISFAQDESKNPFYDWQNQYSRYINHILSALELSPNYWYQITDIAEFYPSIDRILLMAKLARSISDSRVLALMQDLLNLNAVNLEGHGEKVPGLPPGTVYSHFLANLYLDDLDKLLEDNSKIYARYVDDIFFVCVNETDLDQVNQLIRRHLSALGDLFLKERKTEIHPISNAQPLIEHTRKMKYDLRFGTLESIQSSAQVDDVQVTERIFRDLFLTIEREEDITRIVEDVSGFIAAGFGKLSIDSELAVNTAYGILLRRPQRINAIRALLGYLLETFSKQPNERFINFIKESPDIIKISFLQLLLAYPRVNEQVLDLLLSMRDQDANYVVRANVYTALENLQYKFEISELRQRALTETSDYVLCRIIQCFVHKDETAKVWTDLRQILTQRPSNALVNAMAFLLQRLNDRFGEWDATRILFPSLVADPASDLYTLAYLLRLAAQYGDFAALNQVHDAIARQHLELTITLQKQNWTNAVSYFGQKKNDYEGLLRLLDSLKKLGVAIDYFSSDQSILEKGQNPARLDENDFTKAESKPPTSFPDWYRDNLLDVDKGLYCEFALQPEYSCRLFQKGGVNGVLEIISAKTIVDSNEFASANEWILYLKELDKKQIVKLFQAGIFVDNGTEKVFAMYELEPGFRPIMEWLGSGNIAWHDKTIVDILLRTSEQMRQTKLPQGFYFQNVSPCNVLWNPVGEVKLLGIGSALLLPRYVCGSTACNKKYHSDEVGKTTGTYFLGLLAIQMITNNECPILALESSKISRGKRSFYESNDVTPHLKSIIARMVQRPLYRYGDLNSLEIDLARTLDFIRKRDMVPADKSILLGQLTLVDYLDFRLDIAERNPDSPDDALQKTNLLLETLSREVSYYSDTEVVKNLFNRGARLPAIAPRIWYWLSPESRAFIRLAFQWEHLIDTLARQSGIQYKYRFSNILLARVVYFEALSALQGILAYSSLNKEARKSFYNNLFILIQDGSFSRYQIRSPLDGYSSPAPNPYSIQDLNPILNLLSLVGENQWIPFLRRLSARSIFAGINFARHQIDFLLQDETLVSSNQPLLKSFRDSSNVWLIHKLPFHFITELTEKTDQSTDSIWDNALRLIRYLYVMNPCRRLRGKLTDYQAISVPQEGSISFGWNWIAWSQREAIFAENTVLALGNFFIKKGGPRAVQVDVVNRSRKLSSVLSYSNLFESLMNYSPKSLESTIASYMKKNRWLAWVVAVLLAVGEYFAPASSLQSLPIVAQVVLATLIVVVGRLILEPLWKVLSEQFGLIRPEERALEG